MNSVIRFREANCKNCYKCLRSCPVKAISFTGAQQAQVIDKACILCGECLSVCPQNAKIVRDDVEKVRQWTARKEKVYVSLAPSWVSSFPNADLSAMVPLLMHLGFTHVEETATGAAEVSREYARLLQDRSLPNIITTACPTVVSLVEKHYPELLHFLAPVVSPMVAHARMLRATFGPRIRVVFIGPCLSKKEEGSDVIHAGAVDAVLTFEELAEWLISEGMDPDAGLMFGTGDAQKDAPSQETSERTAVDSFHVARLYPASGGILKTLDRKDRGGYTCIAIDGMDRCRAILDSLRNGQVEHYFIEMSACAGSCLEGPCKRRQAGGYLAERERLVHSFRALSGGRPATATSGNLASAKTDSGNTVSGSIALSKTVPGSTTSGKTVSGSRRTVRIQLGRHFQNKRVLEPIPSDAVITGILHSIGKFTPEKELNCGACGYPTCREKAVAVFRNKAQLTMCMPYMQERAASMSNLILSTTPNAILALDMEGRIQEVNRAARSLLRLDDREVVGTLVFAYLDAPELVLDLDACLDVHGRQVRYAQVGITVEQTLVFVPEQRLAVLILRDVTEEEAEREKLQLVRKQTVEIAQKVIDKQMRVAQEIASLLGETTAETKVALTKLKKSILAEEGGRV